MKETIVHDCAATGLYIGDSGSSADIQKCNIIRNGGGSHPVVRRRGLVSGALSGRHSQGDSTYDSGSSGDESFGVLLNDFDIDLADMGAFADIIVPPGHSGMYVETGKFIPALYPRGASMNLQTTECVISTNPL